MKSLIKIITIISVVGIFSTISSAQNRNPAVGKSTKTSPGMSNSGTSTTMPNTDVGAVGPENFNSTGTTQYNNGTGGAIPGADTNTINTRPNTTTQTDNSGTRTTAPPNAAVTQELTLQGVKAEDRAKIVQFARQAGATDAKVEGNTLKYSGGNFNQSRFSTLVNGSLPEVNIAE